MRYPSTRKNERQVDREWAAIVRLYHSTMKALNQLFFALPFAISACQPFDEVGMTEAGWEPFNSSKVFPIEIIINWIEHHVSV